MFDNISKYVNINSISKPNSSIIRPLMLFYVMIASNYTPNLFSRQLREYIEHNRTAQHIIGFTMLLTLMNMFTGQDSYNNLIYSMIIYTWFTFTTKLDLHFNLLIIGLLFIWYFSESSMIYKEQRILEDDNVSDDIIEKVKRRNNKIRLSIVISILTITLIGICRYGKKKNNQYGGDFDPVKFIFCAENNNKCHQYSHKPIISLV